jgi:LPP20 lipoprotein
MTLTIAFGIAALFAASPVRHPDRKPDWVDGESVEWPREQYVVGVGSADEREGAEDRARAEVGRVFSTHVASTIRSTSSESNSTSDGRTSASQEDSAADETTSTTDKLLEGVEIAQVWQDPATQRTYALAVLDRQKSADRLRARLDAVEALAVPLRARLAEAGVSIRGPMDAKGHADASVSQPPDGEPRSRKAEAASAGLRLLQLRTRREAIQADLRVVAPSDAHLRDGSHDEAAARETLARMSVSVQVPDDVDGVVGAGVAGGLSALGFSLQRDPAGADLVGEATLSVEDLGRRDGWFWARATTGIVLRDPQSGRVLAQVNESAREASRVQAEAARRVLGSLSGKLRSSVPAALFAWAAGQ